MTDREIRLVLAAFIGAAVGRALMWAGEKALRAAVAHWRQKKASSKRKDVER